METICSSETSVDFYGTARRYIPEDRTLHGHGRKVRGGVRTPPLGVCLFRVALNAPVRLRHKVRSDRIADEWTEGSGFALVDILIRMLCLEELNENHEKPQDIRRFSGNSNRTPPKWRCMHHYGYTRRLSTATVRVQSQVWSCGICGGRCDIGFFTITSIYPLNYVSKTALFSSNIPSWRRDVLCFKKFAYF
jgi:hypothetical protein